MVKYVVEGAFVAISIFWLVKIIILLVRDLRPAIKRRQPWE